MYLHKKILRQIYKDGLYGGLRRFKVNKPL